MHSPTDVLRHPQRCGKSVDGTCRVRQERELGNLQCLAYYEDIVCVSSVICSQCIRCSNTHLAS